MRHLLITFVIQGIVVASHASRIEVCPRTYQIRLHCAEVRLRRLFTGIGSSQARLRICDLGLEIARIDFCQKITTLDDRVEVGIKSLDLTRHLASDLDRDNGLNCSRGVHDLDDRPTLHRLGIIGHRFLMPEKDKGQCDPA
jgi:hypothetical protein